MRFVLLSCDVEPQKSEFAPRRVRAGIVCVCVCEKCKVVTIIVSASQRDTQGEWSEAVQRSGEAISQSVCVMGC